MTVSAAPARRWIAAAAVLGIALRAVFGLTYWVGKPLTHDEREYLALAKSIQDGRGFRYDPPLDAGTGQQFGRAPGYPAFLALLGAGSTTAESAPARVKLAQSVLGGFAIWLIGLIGLRASGPRTGTIAAAVAAVYPPLVWIPSYVFSETLYSAAALLCAWVLQKAVDGDEGTRTRGAAAAGALIGCAILVRPAMLFFVPLATVWLWRRRGPLTGVAALIATAAVVAPWTVRNAQVYGRFVLVASEGGVTFWTGNHPLARGEGDLAANPELKRAELEFRRAHPGLTAEELEPLYYRDALRAMAADPAGWFALLARKAFYTVAPIGPSYTLHSTKYQAASVIPYLMLLPFAARGIMRLRHSAGRPTAVLLLALSAILVGLVFFPQERFRIPVIDPALIICAAAAARRPETQWS